MLPDDPLYRLSPRDFRRVIRRAIRLQTRDRERRAREQLRRDLIRGAAEAGIDTGYLRQAAEELRRGSRRRRAWRLVLTTGVLAAAGGLGLPRVFGCARASQPVAAAGESWLDAEVFRSADRSLVLLSDPPRTRALYLHPGVEVRDYSGDGMVDLYISSGSGRLYRALGDGIFIDAARSRADPPSPARGADGVEGPSGGPR